jgi:type IV secretory pathway VirJ component
MKSFRKSFLVVVGSLVLGAMAAPAALAQTIIDPSVTPVENKAGLGPITPFGFHISLAFLMAVMGIVLVIIFTIGYMRYAPRFAKDEESMKVVRADRVMVGRELPRRNVDLSQAAPVIVAPPAIPALAAASVETAPAAAVAVAPPAPATPAPATPAPAEAPAPAAETPAPAPAPPAPAAPPAERKEVTMDQAVFETTLQELLDAGTDRRIAEGKAKRAGMIAAKKAAGEG